MTDPTPRRGARGLPDDLSVEVWRPLRCAECRETITEYDPRLPVRLRGWCKGCDSYTILDTYTRQAEKEARDLMRQRAAASAATT